MKLLVCGGRKYKDESAINKALDLFQKQLSIELLMTGYAEGVDKIADNWAVRHGIQPVRCPALWDQHGDTAGPRRSRLMFRLAPDAVLAFPGNSGTNYTVMIAKQLEVPVYRISKAGELIKDGA